MKYIKADILSPGVVLVKLNRPEKRNALNISLMENISNAFNELSKDPTLRVIVLAASGPIFCAGLDLHEAADIALAEKIALHVSRMLTSVYSCPLVTIAAVQGDAAAGGAGLVAACDLAVMVDTARIGFPEIHRGLIAAQVATLLCRQMRMRDVRELLLLGELITANKALGMGLINRIVNDEQQLMEEAQTIAQSVILGAPQAVKDTKHLLEKLDPANFYDDLQTALSFYRSARHSKEAQEGIMAFLEKRKPNWN